eukprot:jgi/Hompol1/2996/HPOL_006286-RA
MSNSQAQPFVDPRSVTPEEQHSWVLWEGTKSAALFGAAGLCAHVLAQRTLPFYQRVSLPFKVHSDRAAMNADRRRALMYSITNADELQLLQRDHPLQKSDSQIDQLKYYVLQNRYSILGRLFTCSFHAFSAVLAHCCAPLLHLIGYGWSAAMLGSLAYNFSRSDIAMAQKLINSRMVAQSLALGGFVALAALASATGTHEHKELVDPHFERIVSENSPAKPAKQ